MNKPRILLIGGGSGGHIMPLMPLIKIIPAAWDIHLLTDQTKTDQTFVGYFPNLPFTHHTIRSGKIRAYLSIKNLFDLPLILYAIYRSYRRLKHINPQVLFFKGGYVGFAMVIALKIERLWGTTHRTIFLHESDITPGKLHAMLKSIATKIFHNFEGQTLFYHEPVKSPLHQKSETNPRPKILVFGGSQGAQWINQSIIKIAPQLTKDYDITLVTGTLNQPQKATIPGLTQYQVLPQPQLYQHIAQSDLVITRGGASLFQILHLQKPCLIIPLPGSARNHQDQNAHYFTDQNLAHRLDQTTATPQDLFKAIQSLRQDHTLVQNLQKHTITSKEKEIWASLKNSI